MLHLNRIDHDIRYAKHIAAAAYKWSEEDVKRKLSWQYRLTEPSAFDDWFYNGGIPCNVIIPEIIPDKWKNIL